MSYRRTFWPATALDELPNKVALTEILNEWVSDWFGDDCAVQCGAVSSESPPAEGIVLFAGARQHPLISLPALGARLEAVVDAIDAPEDAQSRARETLKQRLLESIATRLSGGDAAFRVASTTDTESKQEWLRLEVVSSERNGSVISLWLSADACLGQPTDDQHRIPTGDNGCLDRLSLRVSAITNLRLPVSALKPGRSKQRIALCDLEYHDGFALALENKKIGRAYLGQSKGKRAVLMESSSAGT